MICELSQKGYILNNWGKIEKLSYKEYLREFGADETTTPRGVAPRLFVERKTLSSWGIKGNNYYKVETFATKTEAKNKLYEHWEWYIEEKNWDAPRFHTKKADLYEDLSERFEKPVKVIKRYFKIQEAQEVNRKLAKVKHDNRPLTTIEDMEQYIALNKEMVQNTLKELDALKQAENKQEWQVKANSLIQKVSNNDFRTLNWKEIYNLIRKTL